MDTIKKVDFLTEVEDMVKNYHIQYAFPEKILETDRIILRRFERNDRFACFEFLSDRDTCHNGGGYEPFDEMDEEYERLMEIFRQDESRYMIFSKTESKVVGTISLRVDSERAVDTIELGYMVSPNYRRQGYAQETVISLLPVLKERFHIQMVVAGVVEKNDSSIHMLKKLGFSLEGKRHKAFLHPVYGAVDLLYYYYEL